jgi:hypothetical protein
VRTRRPTSVGTLEEFGRERLSKSFFMRDFLYSDIAVINGFQNLPNDPQLAIAAGKRLCEEILEPLQDTFGRIAIRSAYRSEEVNDFGAKNALNCASNESNFAHHIWDKRDAENNMGATACIVIPSFHDRFPNEGDWKKLAWWIHDHLPYNEMTFFRRLWAFNINSRENPVRQIYNWMEVPRWLTRPGMENHKGSHEQLWAGILP